MKKFVILGLGVLLSAGMAVASPQQAAPKPEEKAKVFVGAISDSMCGAHHVMGGTAKECTLECVDAGSEFVLVDDKGKVYDLSDQTKPRQFAGEKVKITGALKGNQIIVSSITAEK